MNGNWRLALAGISIILVVVGFVLGSMSSQIRAGERFVPKDQYEKDMARFERKVDQLLQFHMEDRRDDG